MREFFHRFIQDECGATAIEYTLIAAGIAIAIVGAISALGSSVSAKFETIQSAVN